MIFKKNLPLLMAFLLGFSHSIASPRKFSQPFSTPRKTGHYASKTSFDNAVTSLQTMIKEALACRAAHDFALTIANKLGDKTTGAQCLIDASEKYQDSIADASDFIRCVRNNLPQKSDSQIDDYCHVALPCADCSESATADNHTDTSQTLAD